MDVDQANPAISPTLCALPDDKMKELEREAAIRSREERLKSILSPIEGLIMSIQSLLVWEKTQPSAVMFLCVNGVFWLAVTTNQRIVFIAAVVSFLIISVETFRYRVWPDMQVEPKEPQDDEGWTPLHLRLLSVPELCDHAAHAWQVADDWYNAFWELRRKEPAKFCTYMCCMCLTIASIGYYIPGVLLAYMILLGLLLWPAILYHDIYGQLHAKARPFLKQFEQSMESLERKEKRQRRRTRSSQRQDGNDSSSDSELNEFCPTPGPAVDAALFHASTVVSDTPSSSYQGTPTYGLIGGILPRGASVEFTDDELNTDNESTSNLLAGLSEMPSYQDRTLDPSGDELDSHSNGQVLDQQQADRTRLRPPSDLFGISTDDEIGEHELDTLDTPLDGVRHQNTVDKRSESGFVAGEGGQSLPPAAAQLLSQTVAAVMSEAITTLSDLGNRAPPEEKPQPKHPSLPVQTAQAGASDPTNSVVIPSGLTPSPQSDSDLAEFEMLDSSELDNLSNQTTEDDISPTSDSSPGAINAGISYLSSLFTRRK